MYRETKKSLDVLHCLIHFIMVVWSLKYASVFLVCFKLALIRLFLDTVGFRVLNPKIYFAFKGQKNKLYTIIDTLKIWWQINGVLRSKLEVKIILKS